MDANQRQMKDVTKGQRAESARYSAASNRTELEDMVKDASKGRRAESAPYSAASDRTKLEDMLTALCDTTEKQFKMVCLNHGPRCLFIRNRTESEDKMKDASERQRTKSPPYSAASISAEVEDMVSRLQVALQAGHTQNILVKNEAENTDYDTRGKRGLLCFIQHKDPKWKLGNKRDKDELLEFFKDTLGFDVKEYNSYYDLDTNLEKDFDLSPRKYYCLVVCISGHGDEKGAITKIASDEKPKEWKTIIDFKKRFGNGTIPTLSGVPKIIILETCRGLTDNKTVSKLDTSKSANGKGNETVPFSPTTDLDFLIIHATTHGKTATIPDEGSVGLQGVMEIFKKNWQIDHLEEMLIDARMKVATWGKFKERQVLEIQTTLRKRLVFMKCSYKQDI